MSRDDGYVNPQGGALAMTDAQKVMHVAVNGNFHRRLGVTYTEQGTGSPLFPTDLSDYDFKPEHAGRLHESKEQGSSTSEVAETMSLSLGVEAKFFCGEVQAQTEMNNHGFAAASTYYYKERSSWVIGHLRLKHLPKLGDLTEDLQDKLQNASPEHLKNTYGLFYVDRLWLGGHRDIYLTTTTKSKVTGSDLKVAVAAQGNFFTKMTATTDFETKSDSRLGEATISLTVDLNGGNISEWEPGKPYDEQKKWQASAFDKPVVTAQGLSPLWGISGLTEQRATELRRFALKENLLRRSEVVRTAMEELTVPSIISMRNLRTAITDYTGGAPNDDKEVKDAEKLHATGLQKRDGLEGLTIKIARAGDYRYLSHHAHKHAADMWHDTGSGRQRWYFEALDDGRYCIKMREGLTDSGRCYLSAGDSGGEVVLKKDKSEKSKWQLTRVEGEKDTYHIMACSNKTHLGVNFGNVKLMKDYDKKSQSWVIQHVASFDPLDYP
eukprot:TRINITY_DN63544_c0_g1_i1.p1 TRINITY_DN63544_c0_g1~~TRINITY_DN63544_c0_g1_i1.p1  ORF type:complete len:494 (-),score=76.33 TRINITY_DN63544_c0_g1_i1:166-1647(-)